MKRTQDSKSSTKLKTTKSQDELEHILDKIERQEYPVDYAIEDGNFILFQRVSIKSDRVDVYELSCNFFTENELLALTEKPIIYLFIWWRGRGQSLCCTKITIDS